jgi:hypothetical protein
MSAWLAWPVVTIAAVAVFYGLNRLFDWAENGRRHPDDVRGQVADFHRARATHRTLRRDRGRWYVIPDDNEEI